MGATAATCGNFCSMSAILIDTGAPVMPCRNEDPGGLTMMSAPTPACRCLESFSMPSEKPTITRMSVTSTAMATMLMTVRIGRCTRLATIILFIERPNLLNQPRIDQRRSSRIDELSDLRIDEFAACHEGLQFDNSYIRQFHNHAQCDWGPSPLALVPPLSS